MIDNGTVISSKYRIVEHTASGGMSEVYKAYSFRSRNYVAIKFLKDIYRFNEEMIATFKNEAKIFMHLNSRYIVKCIDIGEYNNSTYIVMDYIDGPDLKTYLDSNKISLTEAVEIVKKIVKGLGYAHQRNIIHSDLKPQNIIMADKDTPLIIDFGIAHSPVEQSSDNHVVGSVYYLSPEQAKSEPVDKRSDIYSLGVILYEMCTGSLPFQNDDPLTVALLHVHQIPKQPKELNPEIPESLNLIIMRALEKNPGNRYSNAIELLSDLNRVFDDPEGHYILNRSKNNVHWLSVRRNRIIIYSSIVLIVVAALAISIYLVSRISLNRRNNYMPDIVGKTVDQAEEQLKGFKGFVVKVEAQDVEAEDGVVISQEPSAGSIIQDKDTVVIYYSSGGRIVDMPDLIGYSYDEAVEILNQYGIKNIKTEKVYSNESVEGEIVDQNPGIDEQLNTSDQVTLTVSSISDKYIEFVPNVTGMNVKEAVKACFVRGFSAIYIYEAGYGGDGIVYSQDPEASVQDYSGPVTLKISNRNYNKYVSVIPISYLPDCKSIRITADEIIDGITVEMVLYEESFNDPGRFIAENNGTFTVYLYEPYESSDFTASMTIYTDGNIYMKKSATFLQSK